MSSFTNLYYAEFDTTVQNLARDIGVQVVNSASWSKVSPTSVLATTTASVTAGGTTLTFGAGVVASVGFFVGQIIRISDYGASDLEYRAVTSVSSTTIGVSGMSFAHASGVNIYNGNEVFKTTTTDSVDMIFDLMYNFPTFTNSTGLYVGAYRAYSGSGLGTPTDITTRYLWWKSGNNTATTVVHCIVSVSKDHVFISVEGPRESETNADSTSLGSQRNYFFMDSITRYYTTPYDTTAAIFVGGQLLNQWNASSTNIYGHQSRNPLNTSSWEQSKLATLASPDNAVALSQNVQRITPDGSYDLFPYVVFGDTSGRRGRLHSFYFAGYITPDVADQIVPSAPMGMKVTMGGDTYKLLGTNKSSQNGATYGQFGGLANNNGGTNNIVVAVPST